MKSVVLISEKFSKIDLLNLKASDKKTIAIVNKLTKDLKEGQKVKLPLTSSVDIDTSRTVSVDVPSLIRTQYAIFNELSIVYTYEEEKDLEGKAFRVYFACRLPSFKFPDEVLKEPKVTETKRPSSKETKQKAEEKKQKEEAEAKAKVEEEEALDKAFDMKTVSLIEDLCITYGLKLPKEKQTDFESAIYKILTRV